MNKELINKVEEIQVKDLKNEDGEYHIVLQGYVNIQETGRYDFQGVTWLITNIYSINYCDGIPELNMKAIKADDSEAFEKWKKKQTLKNANAVKYGVINE